MKTTTALLTLILFSGLVSATCQTYEDYFINYTIPATISGSFNLTFQDRGYDTTTNCYSLGDIGENMEGQCYIWGNLTNVRIKLINGSSTYQYFPVDVADPDGAILYVQQVDSGTGGVSTYIELSLNGTDQVYAHTMVAPAAALGSDIVNLQQSEFTARYRRNWTFRNETSNALYDFTGTNSTLKAWCNDYSEFEMNLTELVGSGGSLTVQTLGRPKFFLTAGDISARVRQDTPYLLRDDYYIPDVSGSQYTFTLQDYTVGDCKESTLAIQRSIADELKNIHVEQFEQDYIIRPFLENNTQYKTILYCTDSTRDLGPMYIVDSDLTKTILVTRPDLGDFQYSYQGVTIDITKDWGASQVGCSIESEVTTTGYFEVYNYTGSGSTTLDHVGTPTTGTSISFTYTVGDQNGTYNIKCAVNDTTYGLREVNELMFLRNDSAMYEGFDLDTPSTIAGLSREFLFNFISLVAVIGVLGLFSQENLGTGALIGGMMAVGVWYVGWLAVAQVAIAVVIFWAVFIKLSEGKKVRTV